jgi:hypothetical protein
VTVSLPSFSHGLARVKVFAGAIRLELSF